MYSSAQPSPSFVDASAPIEGVATPQNLPAPLPTSSTQNVVNLTPAASASPDLNAVAHNVNSVVGNANNAVGNVNIAVSSVNNALGNVNNVNNINAACATYAEGLAGIAGSHSSRILER